MRIAIGIEYDGTDYCGWQRLSHAPSVQEALETALARVAAHPVTLHGAGRTDSGVHAHCQVAHFDTTAERSLRGWTLGACSNLPATIAVLWARIVAPDFHARHAARSRLYRYRIRNRPVRPALGARFEAWVREPLDAARMQRAARVLLGEHDFSAFRAAGCQSRTPWREVQGIDVSRAGDAVCIDIRANAFLHHMVRNIVGSLLPIGAGERPESWIGELLAGRDRRRAGITAPACGLALVAPCYAAHWDLPLEPCP